MSIDDKMERLYRENKLTEKKGNKSRQNELSYEGYSTGSEEYVYANAIQTEPMAFCPECDGMMLPYLDGHKCNGCGYTEESVKESNHEVEYVRIPEKRVKPNSRIIKPKAEVTSTFRLEELKDELSNLDDGIFDIVASLLGVPNSLEKEGKIDFMIDNYKSKSIERNIQHAKKIRP